MITVDKLKTDIKSLEAQREQVIGNLNAINGAIQFAQKLLAEIEPALEEMKKDEIKEGE